MKRVLATLFFSFSVLMVFGQYNSETIATARPGAANGAGTVGKGVLQFQAGVQFDNVKDIRDSLNWSKDNISENLVIRFGIRKHFEVSAVINHINSTEYFEEGVESIYRKGVNASIIRARTQINKNMAFQVGVETKLRGQNYAINYLAPRFRLMYNTPLGENASLTTNLGGVWNGVDAKPSGFYVFSLAFPLTDKLSLVAESYGDFVKEQINNYFDIGLGYNINKDLLIDLNGGWGQNFPYKSYFLTAGISYRLITKFKSQEEATIQP
jgi:hypothetical protein